MPIVFILSPVHTERAEPPTPTGEEPPVPAAQASGLESKEKEESAFSPAPLRSLPLSRAAAGARTRGARSRGRRGAGARDPPRFSEYWRQYTPTSSMVSLKKLHQRHIWCRSILVSVCHTLKKSSEHCSGRGFSPYQCQSAKKADVKGGRKPPRSACP